MTTTIKLDRPPADPDELWHVVNALWGVAIPDIRVCDNHTPPFSAFSDAYFAHDPNWALWYGSRGTGKSYMLALLALTKAALLDVDVTLLGGSMAQSVNVREHVDKLLRAPNAPRYALAKPPTATEVKFAHNNWIRPIPASQTTVRGPHPSLVCLDEDTLLTTPNGHVRIKDVQPGDVIAQVTGANDALAWGEVKRAWQTGVKDTWVITCDTGHVLRCTDTHQVWSQKGWVDAASLEPGDVLTVLEGTDRPRQVEDGSVQAVPVGVDAQAGEDVHGLRDAGVGPVEGALSRVPDEAQGRTGPEVRGMLGEAEAARHATLPPVPPAMDGVGDGGGALRAGQGHGQSGPSDVEGGDGDGRAAGRSGAALRDAGPDGQVGGGLPGGGDHSGRGPRHVLARPGEELAARRGEASDVGGAGPDGGVRAHRQDAHVVSAHVVSVTKGLTRPVWDITTSTSRLFADGVLVHNCLDEIDEMEYAIYTAAQGQAMEQRTASNQRVPEMTVASSTWQNPEGTFTKVYRDAQTKKMPVHSWCIAEGSLVLTARGEVPIQEVTNQDFVMTRNGFRKVQHVTFMGVKPTVTLNLGDVELSATPDHLIAVPGGWRHAGALAADAMSPVRPNPHVFRYELMPFAAEILARSSSPGTGLIDANGNKVDVLDIHASCVPAEVVAGETFGYRPDDVEPDPAVRVHAGVPRVATLDGLDPVAVSGAAGPVDAFGGEHGSSLALVWDIGVEGDDHEFFANGVLVHNCFKEVLLTPENTHGWMTPEFIERKRRSVPAEMFRVEYELGEPSGMALAFDLASLERAFTNKIVAVDTKTRGEDEEYTYEKPDPKGTYAAGADWAKEKDYTVFVVVRTDTHPWRTAYVRKFNRRPWPYMIESFERIVKAYQAVSAHDATGLGNVVHDMVDERTTKILMVGKDRTKLLTDYITAVEQGRYELARPGPLYTAHRGVTVDEVFGSSSWNTHLADEVAACAIAHRAASRQAPPISGDIVTRGKGGVKWIEELDGSNDRTRSMTVLQEVGVVTVMEEVSDVGVFWLE